VRFREAWWGDLNAKVLIPSRKGKGIAAYDWSPGELLLALSMPRHSHKRLHLSQPGSGKYLDRCPADDSPLFDYRTSVVHQARIAETA
jgi:hypothetical protein